MTEALEKLHWEIRSCPSDSQALVIHGFEKLPAELVLN